jgi:Ca2+-binding EF-hand superfamily protein
LIHFYKRFNAMMMRTWSVTSTFRAVQRSQCPALLVNRTVFTGNRQHEREEGGSGRNAGNGGKNYAKFASSCAAGAAAVAALYAATNTRMELMAETGENSLIATENRVRQFSTPDKIFNYFASYQFVSKKNGRKAMMMTPLEFYSAVTPDCKLVHGVGPGVYVEVNQQEIDAGKVVMESSPVSGSVLNEIGKLGLLSYQDFCFLLALISTPKRYIETTFNMFDVTGDGNIEAKEFAYVSTKMAHKSGGFGAYTDTDQEEVLASGSGLLNYLFGKNRDKTLTKEGMKKLQNDLLDEIVQLEFKEYDTQNTGRISEADFVNFLLKNGKLMPKKKAAFIKKVEARWPAKGRGVSLPSFKSFFQVLAGGQELERALFFLDVEGIGVDKAEFRKISSWVSQTETSDHVVELIYEILDDDEDGRLYRDDVAQVLLDWRHSRGYVKGGIQVSIGQLRI